jgi:hypothetical protein
MNRDTTNGQYTYSRLDHVCVCGHELAEHSLDEKQRPSLCLHGQNGDGVFCDCQKFRKVKRA